MSINKHLPQSVYTSASSAGRNAGKSSMINAITGQNLAIVSDVKGHDHRSGSKGDGIASAWSGGHD